MRELREQRRRDLERRLFNENVDVDDLVIRYVDDVEDLVSRHDRIAQEQARRQQELIYYCGVLVPREIAQCLAEDARRRSNRHILPRWMRTPRRTA